jgi:hypothetical protein
VSPAFPPASAPDLHRTRTSLAYYADFGWQPSVLAVEPSQIYGTSEPELAAVLPAGVDVRRVDAVPETWTRPFGVGSPAFRAGWPLYRAGLAMLRESRADLVFVSTTMFPVMALGRRWKRATGVPFVLDMQDPWLEDTTDDERFARPPKYGLARRLHARLEPYTMREVDGLMAVSEAYVGQLRRRYPWLEGVPAATIPFGVDPRDFEAADRLEWHNPFFTPGGDDVHLVYLGRAGENMSTAATILSRALGRLTGQCTRPVRLWCAGTDYAPAGKGQPTIQPIAHREGAGRQVVESTDRLPYLHGLRLLRDADVLVVLGSHDERYVPSKIPVYLSSGRPVVAVVRQGSPAVGLLRDAGAEAVVAFSSTTDVDRPACELARGLAALVGRLPLTPTPVRPAAAMAPMQARELTRRQCVLFDAVVDRGKRAAS